MSESVFITCAYFRILVFESSKWLDVWSNLNSDLFDISKYIEFP